MSKVVVIGLDGATWDLILPWVEAGQLPTFEHLLRTSPWARMESVPNMNSAPAWTSFMTGKNPGKHGVYWFTERKPGSYKTRLTNRKRYGGGEAFWNRLSSAGKRVGVVNVPMTYPAERVNGFFISGLGGVMTGEFAYPPALRRKIDGEFPNYQMQLTTLPDHVRQDRLDLALDRLIEVIDARTNLLTHLLTSEPWDMVVVVYSATDQVQHFFWEFLDPAHPRHQEYGDGILRIYKHLDRTIADILGLIGSEVTAIIMSDHGAGRNQEGHFYLCEWLAENGWLHGRDAAQRRGTGLLSIAHKVRDLFLAWNIQAMARFSPLVPERTRRSVRRLLPLPGGRKTLRDLLHSSEIDWESTVAYAEYGRDEIWINLAGREPHGIVSPGEEYEQLCAQIRNRLLAWRDPESGAAYVEAVDYGRDLYHGPYSDLAPDILIRWANDITIVPPKLAQQREALRRQVEGNPRNGSHRLHGIALFHGPGAGQAQRLPDVRIYDLAPTILHLHGEPVPDDMDGEVLLAALAPEFAEHPIKYVPARDGQFVEYPDSEDVYTDSDEDEVMERLRGLGYVR